MRKVGSNPGNATAILASGSTGSELKQVPFANNQRIDFNLPDITEIEFPFDIGGTPDARDGWTPLPVLRKVELPRAEQPPEQQTGEQQNED